MIIYINQCVIIIIKLAVDLHAHKSATLCVRVCSRLNFFF